jgi:hypothetical protein
MEQLPKIVSERLRTSTTPGRHIDANLLTAYAEQSLDASERASVAAHLATCSDCREILFLATPPASEINPVPGRPKKSSWLSVPVLKWGTAGALAVIVGAAALLLRPSSLLYRHSEAEYAKAAQAPLAAASGEPQAGTTKLQEPVPPSEVAAPVMQLSKNDLKSAIAPSKDSAPTPMRLQPTTPPTVARTSNLPSGGKNTAELRRDQATPMPVVGGAIDKKAGGAANDALAANGSNFDAVTTTESKETVQVTDEESSAFVKAKPAQAKAEAGAAAAPMAPSPNGALAMSRVARANSKYPFTGGVSNWRISSSGDVQRSMDGGRTWNTVSVAQQTAFRVVTATGSHVWAGGSGGALYHSSDAGATWSAVTPTAAGATLRADITAIAFSDPQNGRVTTSSGETWTTTDAGETWQRP